MNPYVLPLTQAQDPSQAGEKAASLARAVHLGFAVPDGFVLTRAALRFYLETHNLLPAVETTRAGFADLTWCEQAQRFEAFQASTLSLPIPPALRTAIEPLLQELLSRSPSGAAVRSSGICEDLEQASFAGIYESFLGVNSLEAFWWTVVSCWSSAWSPRAAAYAQKIGIALSPDNMAVLVQTLVPAQSSGVIFTADPVTGDPWRFISNATFGLSARLMDGAAPADRFILTWDSGRILEKRIGRKPDQLVCDVGRVLLVPLPEGLQEAASLTDEQAQAVGRLALAVDRAWDRRMDIEWAISGDRLYLLQARPLAALPNFFPHQLSEEEAGETWTPYLTSFGTMNEKERLVAPFYSGRWLLDLWNRFLTPDDVFPHRLGQERDFNGYRYSTLWRWGGGENLPDWQRIEGWLGIHEPHLRQDWLSQLARVQEVNTRLDREMDAARREPAACASDWVRMAVWYYREEYEMQAAVWYAPQWLIFTCEELLARFASEIMPGAAVPDLPAGLLQGLSCYSVERTIAAQALGQAAGREDFVRAAFADQPLSKVTAFLRQNYPECAFLRELAGFCRAFGMELPAQVGKQEAQALDLDGVLLMIKAGLLNLGGDARAVLAQCSTRRAEIEAQARAWLSQNRPDQLARFDKLLDWAQFWTPALDNQKWHCTMTVRLAELFEQTKAALVREGLLEHPDHFLLLKPEEWDAYAGNRDTSALRELYALRRRAYEHNRRLEPLPYLGRPPAPGEAGPAANRTAEPEPAFGPAGQRRVLRGEGIAPGRVRGTACLAGSLAAQAYLDRLTDEHILICGRDTLNAQWQRDWYSLFMLVRGLVTVQGAQLHHAAQIARECGVPFINLPGEDLASVPDGAAIEIDGRAGTLVFL